MLLRKNEYIHRTILLNSDVKVLHIQVQIEHYRQAAVKAFLGWAVADPSRFTHTPASPTSSLTRLQ